MRALLTLAALCLTLAAVADEVVLRDAWIALPPPGARVVAGYGVVENRGARAVQVVAVRAAGFLRAEVHETYREGERMRMRPRPTLELAPGATLELAPGGLHLMLFDPARPPAVGAGHELTLTLADGRTLKARATVRDLRDAAPHAHH